MPPLEKKNQHSFFNSNFCKTKGCAPFIDLKHGCLEIRVLTEYGCHYTFTNQGRPNFDYGMRMLPVREDIFSMEKNSKSARSIANHVLLIESGKVGNSFTVS